MSHASNEAGKWSRPTQGIMCHMRSGRPRSTTTKRMDMITAATAMPSPISTTCLTSSRWNT